jgi:hypothetical protein
MIILKRAMMTLANTLSIFYLRKYNKRPFDSYDECWVPLVANSSVDWIEVEEDGFMTQYDDQATIEWKIMENNEQHFQMTETTPPMQEPLVTELGYLGNTEAARQILDGTYVYPNGINLPTHQFLSSLQATAPITTSNHIVPSFSRRFPTLLESKQ